MAVNKKSRKPESSSDGSEYEPEKKNSDVIFKVSFSRNSANISIELIGSEDYIKRMEPVVNGYIRFLDDYVYDYESGDHEADNKTDNVEFDHNISSVEEAFKKLNFVQIGEMINAHRFSFKDIDMVLLAGAFIQQISPEGTFSTADITKYLKMADISPLKNPSHSLKLNLDAGRVTQSGKKYSLTENGIDRVIRTFSTLF